MQGKTTTQGKEVGTKKEKWSVKDLGHMPGPVLGVTAMIGGLIPHWHSLEQLCTYSVL